MRRSERRRECRCSVRECGNDWWMFKFVLFGGAHCISFFWFLLGLGVFMLFVVPVTGAMVI